MHELLAELMDAEGWDDSLDFLQHCSSDSVCPGICTVAGCGYTTQVEPDCTSGYCDQCEANSVKSALVLAGII